MTDIITHKKRDRRAYTAEYRRKNKESIAVKKKEYYNNNKETIAAKSAEYREENRDRLNEHAREYYHETKESRWDRRKEIRDDRKDKAKVYKANYHQENKEEIRVYRKEKEIEAQIEAFNIYGNKCICCNQQSYEFLTIDHINGGGTQHRRILKRDGCGARFCLWLKRHGWPDGYQTMCFNCNCAKDDKRLCPHQRKLLNLCYRCEINKCLSGLDYCLDCEAIEHKSKRKYKINIKLEAMSKYGSGCVCCNENIIDFLTIDHINGGGRQHYKLLGINGGYGFYYWLRRNNWPDGYQTMCYNCNVARYFNGGICPHNIS